VSRVIHGGDYDMAARVVHQEIRQLAHPASGALTTTGAQGQPSRLIVEVIARTRLSFDMAFEGGGDGDLLTFHINGVPVAGTRGAPVQVDQTLQPITPMTLMWEFQRGTGKAVIHSL
jgi:hypothetical protein